MAAFRGVFGLFQLRHAVKLSIVNQRSPKIWWLRFFVVSLHRNSMNDMKKTDFDIQLITAAILSLGGLVMLYCGIFIEPHGQIHDTLLIGFGEVATFAGALFGIDYTYKYKNHRDNGTGTEKN